MCRWVDGPIFSWEMFRVGLQLFKEIFNRLENNSLFLTCPFNSNPECFVVLYPEKTLDLADLGLIVYGSLNHVQTGRRCQICVCGWCVFYI